VVDTLGVRAGMHRRQSSGIVVDTLGVRAGMHRRQSSEIVVDTLGVRAGMHRRQSSEIVVDTLGVNLNQGLVLHRRNMWWKTLLSIQSSCGLHPSL